MKQLSILDSPDHGAPTLEEVRYVLGDCTRCSLHCRRQNIVFGSGDSKARMMLVGEAPGEFEDVSGLPFVGKSGVLLTEVLAELRIPRERVYITNVVKCRPPNNRDPELVETEACRQFLEMQIAAVRPRVIVALGSIAGRWFLHQMPGAEKRGKSFRYYQEPSIHVVQTVHSAFVLRVPAARQDLVRDLRRAIKLAEA